MLALPIYVQTAQRSRTAGVAARVDAVNSARKAAQEPHGARLRALTRRWEAAVTTNGQIELACVDAEREVKRLKLVAREAGLLMEGGGDDAGTAGEGAEEAR